MAKIENISYSNVYDNELLKVQLNSLNFVSNHAIPSYRDKLNKINQDIRSIVDDNAIVTTFTFKPMLGITSQTDVRGRTSYYSYDMLGRLTKVLDHDYNILKQVEYHTNNQEE